MNRYFIQTFNPKTKHTQQLPSESIHSERFQSTCFNLLIWKIDSYLFFWLASDEYIKFDELDNTTLFIWQILKNYLQFDIVVFVKILYTHTHILNIIRYLAIENSEYSFNSFHLIHLSSEKQLTFLTFDYYCASAQQFWLNLMRIHYRYCICVLVKLKVCLKRNNYYIS